MLLKVVLFAYSQGIIGSRPIERACRDHVTFIALSGDSAPHFTTIADFISTLGKDITHIFTQVLAICDRQGLIGREMFAIDGVKLPSNASKAKSGTRAEFERQAAKLDTAVATMLTRHRETDDNDAVEADLRAKEAKRIERLTRDAAQIRDWLAHHPDERKGSKGSIRKSNRTDNQSAKMATSKGVIQGYCGVAAVDDKHQIIVAAQAHGTGSEQELLMPVVAAIEPYVNATSLITADAGYHSEANLDALDAMKINALIADNGMRQRDERFADQGKHQTKPHPLHDKRPAKPQGQFRPKDFSFDEAANICICPAGQKLYSNGNRCVTNGRVQHKFQGAQSVCGPCELRTRCLRHPARTKTRQVAFFAKHQASPMQHTQRMRERIDSDQGRALYGGRFATVEPVFGNLRHNKRLNRFTLRGQTKVDGQWTLYDLVPKKRTPRGVLI